MLIRGSTEFRLIRLGLRRRQRGSGFGQLAVTDAVEEVDNDANEEPGDQANPRLQRQKCHQSKSTQRRGVTTVA